MTDPVRVAIGDGLEDGFGAVRLAGMNGFADEVVMGVLERLPMILGGKPRLGAGQVEPHDRQPLFVGKGFCEPRDLERGHCINPFFQWLRHQVEQGAVVLGHFCGEKTKGAQDDPIFERDIPSARDRFPRVMLLFRPFQTAAGGCNHLFRSKIPVYMELGCVSDLYVADTLLEVVHRKLIRDPLNALRVLHDCHGVGEAS